MKEEKIGFVSNYFSKISVAAVEITEGILLLTRLENASPELKPICSGNVLYKAQGLLSPTFDPAWLLRPRPPGSCSDTSHKRNSRRGPE